MFNHDDEYFMRLALKEAARAEEEDEVPVGAVVVHDGKVIGRAHNLREKLHDPTAHAEMLAITQASEALEAWRLSNCTMYVTVEPCPMCAGAMVLARIERLVYGAEDPKAGGCGSVFNIIQNEKLNHHVKLVKGVLAEDCRAILQRFFARKRTAEDLIA